MYPVLPQPGARVSAAIAVAVVVVGIVIVVVVVRGAYATVSVSAWTNATHRMEPAPPRSAPK